MYDSADEILAQDSLFSLKAQLSAKGVIPFVGAGMSIPFGYPGWAAFLEQEAPPANQSAVRTLLQRGAYEEAAETLIDTRPFFRDRIKTVFGTAPRRSSELCPVEFLPTIFPSGPVFTTNYDRVLEDVYDKQGRPLGTKKHTVRQMLEFREHVLIKLHGDFSDDESRVLTLRDYVKHYGDLDNDQLLSQQLLPQALAQVFSTESVLFLGCGLRNDRYLRLLRRLAPRTTHYAIIAHEAEDDRSQLFESCNIRPILYSPVENHRFIVEILLFLAGKRTLHVPSTVTIDARVGTELLEAIRSRLMSATVGIPPFDETAFSSALRFRNEGTSASLKILLRGDSTILETNPKLRIPFTQLQRDFVDLKNPADEICVYDFLPNTRDPIRVIVEPRPPHAVVLSDDKCKLSVRVNIVL